MADLSGVTTTILPTVDETFADNLSNSAGSGDVTVSLNNTAPYSDGDIVALTVDPDTAKQATFIGEVSGNSIINVKWTEGNLGASHDIGAVVVDYVSATHWGMISKHLGKSLNPNGSYKLTSELRALIAEASAPVGTERSYYGTKATFDADPASAGWLFPEPGVQYNRVDYPKLYNHFNTVDNTFIVDADKFTFPAKYFGTVRVSLDPAQTEFNTLGKSVGAKTHTLTEAEMPAHRHGMLGRQNATDAAGGTWYAQGISGNVVGNTNLTGGGGAHNNLQPSLSTHTIIKT